MPWWVYVVIAAVIFLGAQYWLADLAERGPLLKGVAGAINPLAYLVSGIFVVLAAKTAYYAWHKSKLLEEQAGIKSIRSLSWKEFECLISEAYRRQGYAVEERGGGGPDGGVDLVLRKNGTKTFVQCKQRRNDPINVSIVRELYGVMAAEGAQKGIIVTSSGYTPDALEFARGKNLELVDGATLAALIRSVQMSRHEPVNRESELDIPQRTIPTRKRSAVLGMGVFLLGAVAVGGLFWIGISAVSSITTTGQGLVPKAQVVPAGPETPPSEKGKAITPQPAIPRPHPATVRPEKNAAEQEFQHKQQQLEAAFDAQYVLPAGCEQWKSQQHMVECANDRIRAKQEYMAR